jgi:hypothetical protein
VLHDATAPPDDIDVLDRVGSLLRRADLALPAAKEPPLRAARSAARTTAGCATCSTG